MKGGGAHMFSIVDVFSPFAGDGMAENFDELLGRHISAAIGVEVFEELADRIIRHYNVQVLQPHLQVLELNRVRSRVDTALKIMKRGAVTKYTLYLPYP